MGTDLKLRFDAGDALEFAKKHDPMPVHVGGDAAGGVLPPGTMSGMYVASVVQRAITDAVVAAGWVVDAGLSFAIDWKRPMFPDDKPATAHMFTNIKHRHGSERVELSHHVSVWRDDELVAVAKLRQIARKLS